MADNRVMKLEAKQKKEKEALNKKINDLERRLDMKQALELEIVQLRGKVNILQVMGEGDSEVMNEVEFLLEEIRAMEDVKNAVGLEFDRGMELFELERGNLRSRLQEALGQLTELEKVAGDGASRV